MSSSLSLDVTVVYDFSLIRKSTNFNKMMIMYVFEFLYLGV